MKQFYFFVGSRERAEGAQRSYHVYKPLPGQTTYLTLSDQQHPVDHTCKAQFDRSENTKAVQLPLGAIIGICHEGANLKECRLLEYTDHGAIFYKATGEVFVIGNNNYGIDGLRTSQECEGMDAAILSLTSPNASTTTPALTAAASPAPSNTNAQLSIELPARTDMLSIDTIENYLLSTGDHTSTEINKILLCISQIRDRSRVGVTRFCYRKQNDDMRIAYGTRNAEIIALFNGENEETYLSNRPSQTTRGRHFNYFDIEKKQWRSFVTDNIISVSSDVLITDHAAIRQIAANASAA